jgi:hypothetical protein
MTKGDNFIVPYFGGRLIFQVVGLTPATSEAVIINRGTQFIITERDQAIRGVDARTVSYEDIGGLKDEIQRVREMIELPETVGILPKDNQETDILRPRQCPNCNEPIRPDQKFYVKCKMVLTYDAYSETIEEKQIRTPQAFPFTHVSF